jgi:hypothetical protein
MSLAAEFAALRASALNNDLRPVAEAMQTSRATVRRKTGATTQDEDTGLVDSGWAVVYDGPFRYVGGSTRRVEIAGVEFQEASGRADFPHNTTDLADDDLIEVTVGEWADTVLRIVEAVKGDQRTARRVPVVEVDRPEEWA